MKKIKNNYNKKLSFILKDGGHFVIDTGEEKEVKNILAMELLRNHWITEVITKKQIIGRKMKVKNKKVEYKLDNSN